MTRSDSARPGDPGRTGFRADIEGMRALAVGLVLLFHAGPVLVPGGFVGVDVFFVISGFLITGLLVAELEATGRISLLDFYARRAKRLLPAAGVVLAASLVLTYLLLPRIRWADTGWDVVASGLYVMNWRLAGQAVDYLAEDQAPSILQHFWSLAVEEQFYLVWPLLLFGVALWAHRRGRTGLPRGRLLLCLALVALPSLAWSIRLTDDEPGRAYFVSTTRMWELAVGGGLAILGPYLGRLPRSVAVGLGWAGLAAVLVAATTFESGTRFPGHAALLPTLGAAAIIAAGAAAGRAGPVALLGRRPLRVIGALSYSLYLWHWPLLVAARAHFGELGPAAGLAVVLVAVVPAVLTHRYVENPVRRARGLRLRPARAIRLGAVCTGVPVLAGLLFPYAVPSVPAPPPNSALTRLAETADAPGALLTPPAPGAAVLGDLPRDNPAGAPVDRVDAVTPDPLAARDDTPTVYAEGCHLDARKSTVRSCVYGVRDADFTVAVAGDSHAAQWVPALQALALSRGWRLVTYTKSGCPFVDLPVELDGQHYRSCTEWNTTLRATLTGPQRPDLLVTSGWLYQPWRDDGPVAGPEGVAALADGLHRTWAGMVAAGVPTVVLRDTPHPDLDVAECVSAHPERLTRCAVPRSAALTGSGVVQERAVAGLADVPLIDLNDAICPTDRCAPVIGGVLVYRDADHLTATYALSLAPRLGAALDNILH
ncbi:acyltransferase family protein [Plantactinospora sonchi]|uniref:Acyltransferase family protein n=1 Tax=Plantactinospora sonchi TaxID=1544735 RepID=A0ABU7S4E2_9ACTN